MGNQGNTKKLTGGGQHRNLTIDFIRGVAILLVVFGHSIQYGSGTEFLETEGYFENVFFKFVYSFHMPLFALLSGYLFYWSMKKDTFEIVKRRLTSIILPMFVWVTLVSLGSSAFKVYGGNFVLSKFLHDYISAFVYLIWFLWAMFWCSLIALIVEKVLKGRLIVYGLLVIPLLFMPVTLNLHLYAFMFPYFAAGFLFNKYKGGEKCRKFWGKESPTFIGIAIAFIVLFLFYGRDSYIYTTGISLLGKNGLLQLGIDVYRWIIGFVGSIMVILLCKMVCEKWNGKGVRFIAYLGRISLGIYILNTYTNSYVLQRITKTIEANALIWIVETVISIALYGIVIELIKKVPIGRKLLLGGR